ncbi:MAG: sigma-E factor negative regulatory protein [Lysobacterales bacterium]
MSKEAREHLSCLMDGEISRETSRFLVRRLGADQELCATWARYHLVRDCLRHHEGGLASEDLCRRVSQALGSETVQSRSRRLPMGWLKPVAGAAVAASVALMAIVMVGPANETTGAPVKGVASTAVKAPDFTSPQNLGLGPTPVTREVSFGGRSLGGPRMNSYLLRHYQATGSTGGRGFVSFVPIVVTKQAEDPVETDLPSSETAVKSGEVALQR